MWMFWVFKDSSGTEGQVCVGDGGGVFGEGNDYTLSLEFSKHVQYGVQLQSEDLQLFSPALSESLPALHLTLLLLFHHLPCVCNHLETQHHLTSVHSIIVQRLSINRLLSRSIKNNCILYNILVHTCWVFKVSLGSLHFFMFFKEIPYAH